MIITLCVSRRRRPGVGGEHEEAGHSLWRCIHSWIDGRSGSVEANTKPFVGQIDTDAEGYIVGKGGARTNISGVFHAGDVEDRV